MDISTVLEFFSSDDTTEGMRVATHQTLGQVLVQINKLGTVSDLSPYLREVFAQAKMNHALISPILDVIVGRHRSEKYVAALVFEYFANTLKREIDRKSNKQEPYSEYELFAFLSGIANALCSAQELVPAT